MSNHNNPAPHTQPNTAIKTLWSAAILAANYRAKPQEPLANYARRIRV